MSNVKFTVTFVINKEKNKVLFAEANSDFVQVLLSWLRLPLGKLLNILRTHWGEAAEAIGGLNTLYTGLSNLDETHFCVRGAKQMLLNRPQALAATCTDEYFFCQSRNCKEDVTKNISLYSDIAKCECGQSLNREIRVNVNRSVVGGDFSINPLTFIITDDLCVAPISSGIIQTLINFGITDIQGADIKTLTFATKEIMELLKLSVTSGTPLTDMLINTTGMRMTAISEPGILLHHIKEDDANSRKMLLKVCLQKSTNKFLFAEATGEFVELIFSFLAVPLGGVEFLLGGKTGLKIIDNLYRSVSNGFDDKCFTNPESKNRLINPKLPHGYSSKNQFLPLSEEAPPKLYYQIPWSFREKGGMLLKSFKSDKENYVNQHVMFIVTDDLTVSPGLATSISILNELGIPLSDVRETELHIGLVEALRILRASLSSKTVLTDALINPMFNKEPKLERKRKQEF